MKIGEYEQIEYTCEQCGKKFSRYKFDHPPRRFCSRECSKRYFRRQSLCESELKNKVKCPNCGNGMILIWKSEDNTCLGFRCIKRHNEKRSVYLIDVKELDQ